MKVRRNAGPVVAPFLFLVCLCPPAAALDSALPQGWDPERFLSVRDVRPGMKGVGRSVFRGTDIAEFDVEILGVMETAAPRGTMILAKLSGQNLEQSGVVAGMSGSPIFVDGKLIGALAFGWPFASDPIAGITPIEEMLALEERPAGASGGEAIPRAGLRPETWESLLRTRGADVLPLLGSALGGGPAEGVSWNLPLAVSGVSGSAGGVLDRWAGSLGLVPVQAGAGTSSAREAEPELRPGSAVAVELVRGDAHIAAIGTLTWRDGDRVWAFGHPMFNLGTAAYPLARAEIVTVMPRLSSSFKMGGAGRTLGTITRDYSAGIMGTLGPAPQLIPMEISLASGGQTLRVDVELLDAETWTSALAGIVAMSTVESLAWGSGPATLRIHTRVELADGTTVAGTSALAGISPPAAFAGEVARVVGLVHGNPFEKTRVRRIAVEASLQDSLEAAFLEQVRVAPGPWRPGASLQVSLALRGYRGRAFTREISLHLPSDLPAGLYRLQVCDGAQSAREEEERVPGRYPPRSLRQLAEILDEMPSLDAVVLRLLGEGSNPVVGGEELPRLPTSLLPVLQSPLASGRAGKTASTLHLEERIVLGGVILGCQELTVTVEPPR